MTDSTAATRRRLLAGAGAGGAALLAGCAERLGLQDGGDNESTDNESAGDNRVEADGVGVVAPVDQQELQQVRVEVQQEVQAGNLSEDEAQAEIQSRQEAVIREALDPMIQLLEENGSIEILEEYQAFAAVRADGDAAALLSTVDAEEVSALVSASDLATAAAARESGGDPNETSG